MAIETNESVFLVDKKLLNGYDYELNNEGDLAIVENEDNHMQSAQNRVVTWLGSRVYDDGFGSDIHKFMKENSAYSLTDEIAYGYIASAMKEMLDDGRVEEILSVTILEREETSVTIQIKIKIGVYQGEIVYQV